MMSDMDEARAKLVRWQCFYDYEGELPDKFTALHSDGSGCNIFYYSHDNQYDEKMYTSASDNDCIMGVDKEWFVDAGYLWFIPLPDNFEVWEEKEV